MPSAPLALCTSCGETYPVGKGCPSCSRRKAQARPSRHARGYTNTWARYSKARLARFPLCVGYPEGIHTTPVLATCTDHTRNAKDHPELFWDQSNHRSMCDDCNKRKAIAEEGGLQR